MVLILYFVFLLCKRVEGDLVGYLAVLLIAGNPIFTWFGRCVQIENFSVLFDVLAVYTYISYKGHGSKYSFITGLLLGMSLSIKLTAISAILGLLLYTFISERYKDALLIIAGVAVLSAPVFLASYYLYGNDFVLALIVTLARSDKWDHNIIRRLIERIPIMLLFMMGYVVLEIVRLSGYMDKLSLSRYVNVPRLKSESALSDDAKVMLCMLVTDVVGFTLSNSFWTYMLIVWFPWLGFLCAVCVKSITNALKSNEPLIGIMMILLIVSLLPPVSTNIGSGDDGNTTLFFSPYAPSVYDSADNFTVIESVASFIRDHTSESDFLMSDPYIAIWSNRRTVQGGLPWIAAEHDLVLRLIDEYGFFNAKKSYTWSTIRNATMEYYLDMLRERTDIKAVVYPSRYARGLNWLPMDRAELVKLNFYPAYNVSDGVAKKDYEVWLRG